jgi:hypothetical protein
VSFSGKLLRLALVRADVSEEHSSFIIRATRIGELGTLAVTSNRRTLRINTIVLLQYYCNVTIVFLRRVRRLLVIANVLCSLFLFALMMEAYVPPKCPFLQEPH